MTLDRSSLARMVDHTLLAPTATPDDVRALLAEAQDLGTYSICVSPSMLPLPWPTGDVLVATVCGFPSGKHTAAVKAFEAADAVAHRFGAVAYHATAEPGTLKKLRGTFDLMVSTVAGESNLDAYLACLRVGGVFVDVGLPEHPSLPAEVRQDPAFHRTGGVETGRDGCRVPLPWDSQAAAVGFGGAAWKRKLPAGFTAIPTGTTVDLDAVHVVSSSEVYLGGDQSTLLRYCLLYTSPSPRDRTRSRMPSSA